MVPPPPREQAKGRSLDPVARAELEALFGDEPLARDRLIAYLHRIQDQFGCLHARHLRALADRLRLAEVDVFEVASFYHHFDPVPDGAAPPPRTTIRICDSVSCQMAGAETLLAATRAGVDPKAIRVVRASCLGACDEAPVALVDGWPEMRATAEQLIEAATAPIRPVRMPKSQPDRLPPGAYAQLRALRTGTRSIDSVLAEIDCSGLRGLGGAGFPTARKWSIVRAQPGPRFVTVNADEGEPGTFKDRAILEHEPHRLLEGALIAAEIVDAARVYLYLRDEYTGAWIRLGEAIRAIGEAGLIPEGFIEMRRGAGAYICGEESAMLESLEGKRGLPRHRPPYIAENGLFGRPTLNHNVETLAWLPEILARGGEWFASQGRNGAKGLRSYSLSGRVRLPGVKVAPAGITARELIDGHGGGMAEGHRFAGFLPGGASGGMLPPEHADRPLDFGTLDDLGAFVGSHAVIVFSDRDDPRAIAANLLAFFARESCGQCTPCRAGTEKLATLLAGPRPDSGLLDDLDAVLRDGSICGLGQAAANPVASLRRFFPEAWR